MEKLLERYITDASAWYGSCKATVNIDEKYIKNYEINIEEILKLNPKLDDIKKCAENIYGYFEPHYFRKYQYEQESFAKLRDEYSLKWLRLIQNLNEIKFPRLSYLNKYRYNLEEIEKLIQLNLNKDDLLLLASFIGQITSDYNFVELIRLCAIPDYKVTKNMMVEYNPKYKNLIQIIINKFPYVKDYCDSQYYWPIITIDNLIYELKKKCCPELLFDLCQYVEDDNISRLLYYAADGKLPKDEKQIPYDEIYVQLILFIIEKYPHIKDICKNYNVN